MKVGIIFNCQHRMLAEVLRQVRPDIEVKDYDLAGLLADPAFGGAVLEEMAGCDQVLSLQLGESFGRFASSALRGRVRHLTVLPAFTFAGFHPDMIYIESTNGMVEGFTAAYHSRLAVAGFLEGLTPAQTTALYNALVMGRAGYFDVYAQERALLGQLLASFGIDLEPMLGRWAARGCFMHSINHPRHWCYADVALGLCQHAGLAAADAVVDADQISDALGQHASHPVLPPLARRLGVPAEAAFKPAWPHADRAVPLERFVELEFECFAQVAAEDLARATGVAALRDVLH